jgi:hypothetical protein
MRYASPHSFRNEVTLKLRDGTHNVKQQLAGGCRGVDPLSVGNEVNAQASELLQTVHQVLDRSRETVELPD